jgi:hypothetical protein
LLARIEAAWRARQAERERTRLARCGDDVIDLIEE